MQWIGQWSGWILTTAALVGAVPAQAASLDSAILDIFFDVEAPRIYTELLPPGTSEFAEQSYDLLCFEEECDGLPVGGALADSRWRTTLGEGGGAFLFESLMASDIGSAAQEHYFEAIWSDTRELRLYQRHDAFATTAGCGDCTRSFSWGGGTWQDGDRWYASVWALSSSAVRVGRQELEQAMVFRVTAVPEPASWAAMIAGFGAVGGALRRTSLAVA